MQKIHRQINNNTQNVISLRELKQVFHDWVRKLLPIGQKHSQRQTQELKSNNAETAISDAVFIGWQKTSRGEVFPLYNITAMQHPLFQSTVSEKTLRDHRLQIPSTPFPPEQL